MTDGTNPPTSPQPEPAPGSGGYGFPPGPPAQGGYGFPPGQNGQGGYGYPPAQGGYGYPPGLPAGSGFGPAEPFDQAPGQQWPPQDMPGGDEGPPVPSSASQPDWEAMADRSAAERRKKRLWTVAGTVTVLALLAGGGTFFLLNRDAGGTDDGADDKPSASASGSPGASEEPDYTPTVEGDPTLLRDQTGHLGARMGSEVEVKPLGTRFEMLLKGNPNSYAQAAEPAVDTTKSFTVSARVYNTTAKGARMAVSQGDGNSFCFELGADEVNGKQAWVFRVQTGDKGAASTTQTVAATGVKTVGVKTTLTGTYDAEKKIIILYVDGTKAGEAPAPAIWQGPGPLQIGRARHHDVWSAPWQGAVDNVWTFAIDFSPEKAAAVTKGKVVPTMKATHSWLIR
uniref:LamG-like jellyroll fold domain-containing protein n=1 Tax=Streptomyces sp. NBC_00049 TaxID=2903617 RepID=A0AAU2JU25_9ACTN